MDEIKESSLGDAVDFAVELGIDYTEIYKILQEEPPRAGRHLEIWDCRNKIAAIRRILKALRKDTWYPWSEKPEDDKDIAVLMDDHFMVYGRFFANSKETHNLVAPFFSSRIYTKSQFQEATPLLWRYAPSYDDDELKYIETRGVK